MINLKDSVLAAKELLGYKLVHNTPEGVASGYIVETESYNMLDEASHSFNGKTLRTEPMFKKAGTVYVYFTYGMHYCMNIATGDIGDGQAVLIRALQPVDGIELMQSRRGIKDIHNLTNGPAKLAQALAITKNLNGASIFSANCNLCLKEGFKPQKIIQTTRIGIKKAADKPWRFYVADNPCVSKK